MSGNKGVLEEKSFLFALRIVGLYRYLSAKNEFILSKQIMRSGTAVGALVAEARFAETSKDFIHKLSIARKEANETSYWLELLYKSDYINSKMHTSIQDDNIELLKLLTSSIKTKRKKNEKK